MNVMKLENMTEEDFEEGLQIIYNRSYAKCHKPKYPYPPEWDSITSLTLAYARKDREHQERAISAAKMGRDDAILDTTNKPSEQNSNETLVEEKGSLKEDLARFAQTSE